MGWIRGSSFYDDSYINNDRSRGLRFDPHSLGSTDDMLAASRRERAEDGERERRQEEFARTLAAHAKAEEERELMRSKEAAGQSPVHGAFIDWTKVKP